MVRQRISSGWMCIPAAVTQKIKRLEQELPKIANRHAAVRLLTTISGVGIRTAEAVVAYVDDNNRFGKLSALATCFGLVPRQDASAAVNAIDDSRQVARRCAKRRTK